MKKHYILLTAISGFIFASGNAQTLTAIGSNPVIGETFNFVTTSYFAPGNSGSSQTWNLGAITGTPSSSTAIPVGSTPNGGSFSFANVALATGGAYSYVNAASSVYQNYGYAYNGTVIPYSDPEDQIYYPFAMSNNFSDTWASVFVSGGYTFYREGMTTVTADGSGTLITPSGTYTGVLRVHFVQNYTDSANIGGNPYMITYSNDEYFWYKDGIHFALASTYTLVNSSSGTSTGGSYYVSTTLAIDENENLISDFELFPNPASGIVRVNFTNENSDFISLSVINIAGQEVYSEKFLDAVNGEYCTDIDISRFAKGAYFVRIQTDKAIRSERMIVE
jgi:hypothetical protein